MSPDPDLSIHMYLRILCKIHVSDSCLSIFKYQGPLQHPVLASTNNMDPLRVPESGFMSQYLCISGSSARSMSPDPCLSIHMYLRILCKIHVSDSCLSNHQYDGSSTRSMSPDSCLSIFISQDPLQDPCLWFHVSASMCI